MSEYSRFRSHLHLSKYAQLSAILLFVSFVFVACGPTTQQDTGPRGNPTTATPQPWLVSAVPITLDSVADIQAMGRLDQPDVASTIMDAALSPDNTRLGVLTNTQLVVWDLLTGETVFFTGRGDATQLFYSPDKAELYGLTPGGTGLIFDAETGALDNSYRGHDAYSGVAAFDREAGWLALGGLDGVVKVWDPLERTSLATISAHEEAIVALALSPDGDYLASATSRQVRLWDWRVRSQIQQWNTGSDIARLAFSPDGELVAAGTRSGASLWNVADGEQVYDFRLAPNGASRVLAFSPDGHFFIGGSDSAGLHLWSLTDGALVSSLPELEGSRLAARFSPDSTLLITASFGGAASIWNLTNITGDTLSRAPLPLPSTEIIDVFWTDDGRLLLFIDARGPIYAVGIPETSTETP
ncbi:MAG: hypothetical protein KJ065_10155 [Anaerolineae bacterium]|nr:hypothetical protein [Anaerolineae bacterium]